MLLRLLHRARYAALFGVLTNGLLQDRRLTDPVAGHECFQERFTVGGDPACKPEGFGLSAHDGNSNHDVPLMQIMLYLFYRMVDTVFHLVYNHGTRKIMKGCRYD